MCIWWIQADLISLCGPFLKQQRDLWVGCPSGWWVSQKVRVFLQFTSRCQPRGSDQQSVRQLLGRCWSRFLEETRRQWWAYRRALGGGVPQTPGCCPGSPRPPGRIQPERSTQAALMSTVMQICYINPTTKVSFYCSDVQTKRSICIICI